MSRSRKPAQEGRVAAGERRQLVRHLLSRYLFESRDVVHVDERVRNPLEGVDGKRFRFRRRLVVVGNDRQQRLVRDALLGELGSESLHDLVCVKAACHATERTIHHAEADLQICIDFLEAAQIEGVRAFFQEGIEVPREDVSALDAGCDVAEQHCLSGDVEPRELDHMQQVASVQLRRVVASTDALHDTGSFTRADFLHHALEGREGDLNGDGGVRRLDRIAGEWFWTKSAGYTPALQLTSQHEASDEGQVQGVIFLLWMQ